MSKKYLTREEILSKKDLVTEDVYVEPWGGWVCVRSLTGKERDRWEKEIVEVKGKNVVTKDNIRAKLVALAVIDPQTLKPIFSNTDIEILGEKNAAALDAIYSVASRLSKVSEEDVEELAKNSSSTQGEDSTSA